MSKGRKGAAGGAVRQSSVGTRPLRSFLGFWLGATAQDNTLTAEDDDEDDYEDDWLCAAREGRLPAIIKIRPNGVPPMPLTLLFPTAFLTALSGALMPGPVLFVTLRHSAAGGRWAGPLVVVGHALVEAPLVAAVVLGLRERLRGDAFLGTVGLAGGAVLLAMSAGMLRSLPSLHLPGPGEAREDGAPGAMGVVVAGAVTSLSNPYFFLWWATIGMGLLAKAAPYALPGYAVFYVGHVLADLVWYAAVAESVHRGRKVLSDRAYRVLVGVLAVCLAGFAVWFAWGGAERLFGR